ncbi:MAG: biotin transporter BioY [Verrucomicrobia bacterium]|nr:biotin transporter BioY [Verrucomicrobiota bacterium]
MTQKDAVLVKNTKFRFAFELMIACLGSCFLAVMSQVAMRLTISPIPITLQTLAVFLLAGVLGSQRGVYSVLAYLIQGCSGLPVFAGGVANPLWLLGPQAGFLISFVVAAYLIGKLIERRPQGNILYLLFSLGLGQLAIFAIGMVWLSFFIGISKAFILGIVPFLPGAALKIMAGATMIRFYKAVRR